MVRQSARASIGSSAHAALRSFYEQHAPHLLPKVPSVLKSFRDRLPDLERRLQLKYGMAPTLQPADLSTARPETSMLLLAKAPPSSLLSLLSYCQWDALLAIVRRSCLRLRSLAFEAEPCVSDFEVTITWCVHTALMPVTVPAPHTPTQKQTPPKANSPQSNQNTPKQSNNPKAFPQTRLSKQSPQSNHPNATLLYARKHTCTHYLHLPRFNWF
jgi:hypothetical protein